MKGIYKITSPTGKVYIGKTKCFSARKSVYRKLYTVSIGRALCSSLKKYGFDSHEIAMIHELPNDVDDNILSEYEKVYISFYKQAGFTLLNLTDGGDGSLGYRHTDEAKKKLSLHRKGMFMGKDNPNYGKGCFGINNGAFGKNRRHLTLLAAKANEKTVFQYSKDGTLIKEHESITKAAKELNLKVSNISACVLNKPNFKTAGGFIWK